MVQGCIPTSLLCLLLITCSGGKRSEERIRSTNNSNLTQVRLLNSLLDGYERDLRPVKNWKNSTMVYIDVTVYAILSMDEKEQLLSIYFLYNRYWTDEFLQWDPLEYDNITLLSIHSGHIWIPDVLIKEIVHSEKDSEDDFIYINSKGQVNYQKPIRISTMCAFHMYAFPFDKQTCTLSFESQLHTVEHINVSMWRKPEAMKKDLQKFYRKGEFEFLSVTSSYFEVDEQGDKFGVVKFFVTFKRYPMFYIVNLIIPSAFLVIMDVIGFYLPPESGERISFKITVLLGYSVFLIIVAETLPALAHETALIEVYFVVCLALLVISLTESIFIVRLVNRKNIQSKVPKWIKKLILENKFVLLCFKDKSRYFQPNNSSSDTSPGMDSTSTDELSRFTENGGNVSPATASMKEHHEILQSILNEIAAIRQDLGKDQDQDNSKEWLIVGYVFDKFLFWVYLVTILIYAVSLTICWFESNILEIH